MTTISVIKVYDTPNRLKKVIEKDEQNKNLYELISVKPSDNIDRKEISPQQWFKFFGDTIILHTVKLRHNGKKLSRTNAYQSWEGVITALQRRKETT